MAAQWNTFLLSFLLSVFFLSFIFPRLISVVADWMSTILPHTTGCGLSKNLECRSEMCCTRLTENTGHKKSPNICHLGTIAQLCCAVSSQLRHVSTIGKKQQYLLHKSPQYGERRPINCWDRFTSLGEPQQISTGFAFWLRYCSDVAQLKATKLCTMFGRLLCWYTIYTFSAAHAT